jgi:hypothetical protein
VFVGEAREAEEPGRGNGARREAFGNAHVLLDDVEMRLEAGPTREAVVTGDDELRGAQRGGDARTIVGRGARVVLRGVAQRVGIARPHGSLQVFRLLLELLEVGLAGKGSGRHGDLLSRGLRSASSGRKEDVRPYCSLSTTQVGSALPADRRRPAAPSVNLPLPIHAQVDAHAEPVVRRQVAEHDVVTGSQRDRHRARRAGSERAPTAGDKVYEW